jgi:hypothetical protein
MGQSLEHDDDGGDDSDGKLHFVSSTQVEVDDEAVACFGEYGVLSVFSGEGIIAGVSVWADDNGKECWVGTKIGHSRIRFNHPRQSVGRSAKFVVIVVVIVVVVAEKDVDGTICISINRIYS